MNRQERRKLNKKQIDNLMVDVKADVTSAFLLCPLRVLKRKYNWNDEQIQQFTVDLIEEYNKVDDFYKYRQEVYEEDGIAILPEDEAKVNK